MKLLTKTTLYFIILMLPVFAAGAFYLFHQFNKEIKHETDEELVNDHLEWLRYLDTASVNNPIFRFQTQEFRLIPTHQPVQQKFKLKGVALYQETEDTYAPFRELSQVINLHGQHYQMILRKSMIEKDDLLKNIITVMLLAFGGLLLFVVLSNWFISRQIWRPFYRSLDKIQQLQLNKMETLRFAPASTYEFNQLNKTLNQMTHRIHQDYINIKELTEDAAHEMQTPLAIAQSKLELLLQDENLSGEQLKNIGQAGEELQRLSRLHHNLLLLAKIENQQFPVTLQTDLCQVLTQYLSLFEELVHEKELTIETSLVPVARWPLHPALADILISNLLGNAIKYNYPGGRIHLSLTDKTFRIANTSHLPEIPPANVFQRFRKNNPVYTNSNGLGLAIVKKIGDSYAIHITYQYLDNLHIFTASR
ncbi:Signal transduction histidine kinase [Chitinophaga eiseniae]|uniref:histidine kinase n=1 Tax=Chitinophaga eiseniae TaxID=634771 RepID=A0A1T4T0Z4_9BACT|nr:HAMP domain-containing sensor histidine kinase [Chitinophaga eiseniae]SKA34156.1 Signal transduction histidine kinase [Chitinophaga eiseniae]